MNPIRPRVFIGSSTEGKEFAFALKSNLDGDHDVTVWNQDVFRLGYGTLEGLIAALDQFDFAVFVFSPDDEVNLRGQELVAPRDNVFFECGLFMGQLGRDRTYFVRPANMPNMRIPSDLLGITGATFDHERHDENWVAALGSSAEEIRRAIRKCWIGQGFQLSRYLPAEYFSPQSEGQWLMRIMQSGYFCGIDEVFWHGYCSRMQTNKPSLIIERAAMIAQASKSRVASICPDDVYPLMQVLFERVVKKAQRYFAIATDVDLRDDNIDPASEKFLFEAPNQFPDTVWRLFLLPDLHILQNLKPKLKDDLLKQVAGGATLRVLQMQPCSRDNFGVYGDIAVGTLDPETRWNVVNFDRTEVTRRQEDFFAHWARATPLRAEMLEG